MTAYESAFLSSNAVNRIRYKLWQPDSEPRACLQLMHGLCGHLGRFEDAARWFCGRGFLVAAHDCLGHGPLARDSGDLGYFADENGWAHVVNDFDTLNTMLGEMYPGLPRFVLGNSMGSFIVRSFLIRFPDSGISGAVLTASSMNPPEVLAGGRRVAMENLERKGGKRGRTGKILAYCFHDYNARFAPNRTVSDWVNRDPKKVDALIADPLTQFFFTIGLFLDMTDGQEFNADPENLKKMNKKTPVLIVSGAEDGAGDYGKSVALVDKAFREAGMADVSFWLLPGVRHDVLDDIDREAIRGRILGWMEKKM